MYKLFGRKVNSFFDDTPPAEVSEEPKTDEQPASEEKPKGRFYTQDEINRLVKADKDRAKRQNEELIHQLTKLKEQGVTPENLDALNVRIDQLTADSKTKEQLAQEKSAKEKKEWEGRLSKSENVAKEWRGKYETYRAKTEILAAAHKHDAHNPEQIYEIVKNWTSIVEDVGEDGKPTGEFVPRVKFDTSQDGKPVTLNLSVGDAIKRMTEMEQHYNLFNSGASNGLGGQNNGRQGAGGNTAPTNMADYMAYRRKRA